MAGTILQHAGSGTSKDREYAYRDQRAWLATVIADDVSRATAPVGDGPALDVASSYVAAFGPFSMPAVGHAYRLPDGSIEHDGTYVRLPRAEEYEDGDWGAFRGADDGRADEHIPCTGLETREELEPLIGRGGGWTLHLDERIRPAYLTRPGRVGGRNRSTIMISIDSGGGFVRDRDGRIVRDRRRAAWILRDLPDLRRFALALFAEPAPTGRKRRKSWTIARGLLLADLQPVLGQRPAARRLLAWEDELEAPWRIPGVARLVSRFEAGGELSAKERQTLRRAEQTMIRSCGRAGVEQGMTGSKRHV
jgi:hypothetical protein